MRTTDVLILGAGCAGTSLAHYLTDFGFTGNLALIDSRMNFDREQRWCSWAKLPVSLSSLVKSSWQSWKLCDEKNSTIQTSGVFTYQQIYAPDFFAHFHPRWQSAESPVELSLGEKVERVEKKHDFVEVTTNKNVWRANKVFDARHQGSSNLKNAENHRGIYFYQTFLGWKIEFPRKVFDEKVATLMDFRTAQTDGINFIYVLPYSETEALIESTSFSKNPTAWVNHLQAISQYIAENFGDDYQITAEESGELPMTTANLSNASDNQVLAIGVAGGSARPSSGYAFHRIQRQTAEIARAIVEKGELPKKIAAHKYRFLDAVFLELMTQNPKIVKDVFLKMFADVQPEALIRFLIDESSYSDDLAVIAALPKLPFASAAWQNLWRKLTTENKRDAKTQLSNDSLYNSVDNSARRLVTRQFER